LFFVLINLLENFTEKKKREYFKGKDDDLEKNTKTKIIRGVYRDINEFKKRYQPRNTLLKDEKGVCLQTPTIQ
jgi:hypothetical protein